MDTNKILSGPKRKNKGFTLVELLIVFVIISILSGMLLLVAGSGRNKAMATKIISDMRTLKSATLMYYHEDERQWPSGEIPESFYSKYLDRKVPESSDETVWYSFDSSDKASCLVVANLPDKYVGVKKKLAAMAQESSIYEDKELTKIYGETSPPPKKAYMPVAINSNNP